MLFLDNKKWEFYFNTVNFCNSNREDLKSTVPFIIRTIAELDISVIILVFRWKHKWKPEELPQILCSFSQAHAQKMVVWRYQHTRLYHHLHSINIIGQYALIAKET